MFILDPIYGAPTKSVFAFVHQTIIDQQTIFLKNCTTFSVLFKFAVFMISINLSWKPHL